MVFSIDPMFGQFREAYRQLLRFTRNLRHRVTIIGVKKACDTSEKNMRNGPRNSVRIGFRDALQAGFEVANVRFRGGSERQTLSRFDGPRTVGSPADGV